MNTEQKYTFTAPRTSTRRCDPQTRGGPRERRGHPSRRRRRRATAHPDPHTAPPHHPTVSPHPAPSYHRHRQITTPRPARPLYHYPCTFHRPYVATVVSAAPRPCPLHIHTPCLRMFICTWHAHTTAHARSQSNYSSPLKARSRCGGRRTRRRVGKPGHADKAPLRQLAHPTPGWGGTQGGGHARHTRTATHARHARGAHCTPHTIEAGAGESAPTCARPRAPYGSLFRA